MFYTNPLQLSSLWRLWFLNILFMIDPGEPGNQNDPEDTDLPGGDEIACLVIIAVVLLVLLFFGGCFYILDQGFS